MIITTEHMRAFEDAAVHGFELRMLERIRKYFPKHEKCLDEPQQLELVRLAVAKAQSHVFTAERSIALYLDLMCTLGSEFDTDPQIPWAAAILADHSFPSQADRIDHLHTKGWEFARKVSADFHNDLERQGGSRLMDALSEIRRKSLEELTPDSARNVAGEIFGRIKEIFPVKSETIGDECIRQLVLHAMKSATSYGIRNARGVWLFTAMMSVAGAGFHRDPQLPWVTETLLDEGIDSAAERVNQLYVKALAALRQWWDVEARAVA